jgi:predicted CopG family antitoxin
VAADGQGETMPTTITIDDELRERLDRHLEDDETYEELIEELVTIYESEGAFLQEGYSE